MTDRWTKTKKKKKKKKKNDVTLAHPYYTGSQVARLDKFQPVV